MADEKRRLGDWLLAYAAHTHTVHAVCRQRVDTAVSVEFMAHQVPSQAGNETVNADFETLFVSFPCINSHCLTGDIDHIVISVDPPSSLDLHRSHTSATMRLESNQVKTPVVCLMFEL
mgnify:CR=1 FL=1|jgi:hypothetical protein